MLQPHETIQHHHVKFHRDKWTALTNQLHWGGISETKKAAALFSNGSEDLFIGSIGPEVHLRTLLVVVHFLERPDRLKEGLSKYCYFIILIFVSCSKYCFLKKNVCQVDAKYWNIHVISSETIQKVSKPQRCGSCPFQRVSILFFQVRELTSFLLFREFWFSVPFEKFGCPFHFR